jgi:cytidylate kinase
MNDSALDRAVERAFLDWEARRRIAAAERANVAVVPGWTVALAREAGTQGTAVAHEVGRRLGWNVYDHELLEKIAREMGLRTNLLESVDERKVSWLQEALENFMAVPMVSESAYVRHLIETVLALGSLGRCVIVGRGAAHVLPIETTLRVRLVAPLKDRVAAVAKALHLSHEEALKQVEDRDRAGVRFIRDHFLRDPTDPHNYDLIVNAARFSTAECADLIIDSLHRLQIGRSQYGEALHPDELEATPVAAR